MPSPVEDWHGKTLGMYGRGNSLHMGMSDYTAGTHVERLVEKTLVGDKVMVGRAVEKKVSLTIGFGDEGELATMFLSPARARQIAASLINKADTIEGVR